MSKPSDKRKIRELRARLERLSSTPQPFDQLQRSARVELARQLCDDAFRLYGRRSNKPEEEALWREAASLFHKTLDEAYPGSFEHDFAQLKNGDPAGLESAVRFLEQDPWFFRSGYVKADLIRFVLRCQLPGEYAARLQSVVLRAIDFRDRREFRWFCKLAKKVNSAELRQAVEQRLTDEDPNIRRRARWVLSSITHNKAFHISRALKQYKREKYRDAIGDLSRAILLEPGSIIAFVWRGRIRAKLQEYEAAIADFDRTIALATSEYVEKESHKFSNRHLYWAPVRYHDVTAYKWRGWSYAQIHKYEQAVNDFSTVLELRHNDQYAFASRGRALLNLSRYEEALDDLNVALSLKSDDIEALHLRGRVYLAQDNPTQAIEEFETVLWLDSTYWKAHLGISEALFNLTKYQESLDAATRAIALESNNAELFVRLAKASIALGRSDDALTALNKSIELQPRACKGEHYFLRAQIYSDRGDEVRAQQDLQAALTAGWVGQASRQNNIFNEPTRPS